MDLNLFHNRIRFLRESIGYLRIIKKLNMLDNRLKALPESFWNLKTLEVLYMPNKFFKDLPQYFKTIKTSNVEDGGYDDGDEDLIGDGTIFDAPPWGY